ncbi:HEAT repeat-containing protein 6 [Entophlyctis sp. JEL0112]|nr:HEAT repeat-containing protein 6 [Entophlyctis sp. JEL0112]
MDAHAAFASPFAAKVDLAVLADAFADSQTVASALSLCASLPRILKLQFSDLSIRAKAVELTVDFFLSTVLQIGDSDISARLTLLNTFELFVMEAIPLKKEQMEALLPVLIPLARQTPVSQSQEALHVVSSNFQIRRAAIMILSFVCVKTGKSAAVSVQEAIFGTLYSTLLEKSCYFSESESWEKMMLATLKGLQILLSENSVLFAVYAPQMCARLHGLIFATDSPKYPGAPTTAVRARRRSRYRRPSDSAVSWRSGSDSDASIDTDSGIEDSATEKLKASALNVLQQLAKIHGKLIYQKWPLFMSNPSESLFTILTSQSSPRSLKLAAIGAFEALLSDSQSYLSVADARTPLPPRSFTSLSQQLASIITDIHKGVASVISKSALEKHDSLIVVGLLKLAGLVARVSPYSRLGPPGDLRVVLFDAVVSLAHTHESVRAARNDAISQLLDAGLILTPASKVKIDPSSTCNVPAPSEAYGISELNLLCSIVRNQFEAVDAAGDWKRAYVPNVLNPRLSNSKNSSNGELIACMHLIDQYAECAAKEETCDIEWWIDTISRFVEPALQSPLGGMRSAAIQILVRIPVAVFAGLPERLQLVCKERIFTMRTDNNDHVRTAVCYACGTWVMLDWFYQDIKFVESVTLCLRSVARDSVLSVRVKASWALANYGDMLLVTKSLFPDEIHTVDKELAECAIFLARDSEKCRSSGVRAIGNFLKTVSKDAARSVFSENLHEEILAIVHNISSGPFKVRWNACHAASNLFNSEAFHAVYSPAMTNIMDSLIDALTGVLTASKNYKVRINAAMALGSCDTLDVFGSRLGTVVEAVESALTSVDDLGGTEFGEYRYKSELEAQLHKCVELLRRLS